MHAFPKLQASLRSSKRVTWKIQLRIRGTHLADVWAVIIFLASVQGLEPRTGGQNIEQHGPSCERCFPIFVRYIIAFFVVAKMSSIDKDASICIRDRDMADEDESTSNYRVAAKVDINAFAERKEEDEALQRYKENVLHFFST